MHAFAPDRKLILGGIEIPFRKGLLGHSDADVLLHAIADALLGALALGDIGQLFPDTDDRYKNADSVLLLRTVYSIVKEKNYSLVNLDSVIAMQQPKIAPFIPQMRKRIAEIFETEIECVSVKATTTEKLGFVGREEGVSAWATVLLIRS